MTTWRLSHDVARRRPSCPWSAGPAHGPMVALVNGRWWLGAVLLSGAVYGLAWWALDGQAREADQRAQARRDSVVAVLAQRHALDSVRLVGWADSVVQVRGDSLRALLASTAARAVVRLPAHIRTVIERDTLRDTVVVAGADVRVLLVSDSAQRVRGDSLQGELDQCVYDLNEAMSRPAPAPRWSWGSFQAGVGVGAAGASAACIFAK